MRFFLRLIRWKGRCKNRELVRDLDPRTLHLRTLNSSRIRRPVNALGGIALVCAALSAARADASCGDYVVFRVPSSLAARLMSHGDAMPIPEVAQHAAERKFPRNPAVPARGPCNSPACRGSLPLAPLVPTAAPVEQGERWGTISLYATDFRAVAGPHDADEPHQLVPAGFPGSIERPPRPGCPLCARRHAGTTRD